MELGCCISIGDIQYAEHSGFDFIELPVNTLVPESDEETFQNIKNMILNSKCPVKSFNAFLPPDLKITGPNIDSKRINRYVENAFKRMAEVGASRVSFGSGASRSCPSHFSKEIVEYQIIEFLEFASALASDFGIQINIESLNKSECNMINSLLEAKRYVEMLHLPNVSLIADFYHMQMERESLKDLFQVKNILNYVHVADTGRFYPGSGDFPFHKLFETLQQIDYTGDLSIECTWRNAESEIPFSRHFLKSFF